jgi:hypothetical protein
MILITEIPEGVYWVRKPSDCPVNKKGRADRNGKWETAIGVEVIKATSKRGG